MKSGSLRILGLVLLIVFLSVGCKKDAPPVIKKFGPTKTKAGQGFNIQPDGVSAMWVRAANVTDTTVIVWGDTRVPTFRDPKDSNVITAPITKELYAKPGQYQIYLLDTKTGAKSNSGMFIVK